MQHGLLFFKQLLSKLQKIDRLATDLIDKQTILTAEDFYIISQLLITHYFLIIFSFTITASARFTSTK